MFLLVWRGGVSECDAGVGDDGWDAWLVIFLVALVVAMLGWDWDFY